MATRPTTDKARQAVCNTLAHEIPDARVLDLCAGSGAVGIEALSRGARSAVFVDNSARATAVIRRNLERLGLLGDIHTRDWRAALHDLNRQGEAFDIIYADPPYAETPPLSILAEVFGERSSEAGEISLLAPEGILIIESAIDAAYEPMSPRARLLKTRAFGHTRVSFYTHASPGELHTEPS